MSLKLKPTVIYKKDRDDSGLLFSVGDDSSKILRVRGLINEIVLELTEGKDYGDIKTRILGQYDVDEAQFTKDIEAFKVKLTELNFLDD